MYITLGLDSIPSYCTGYHNSPLWLSNTGTTAFLDAEVQQPNTVATLSFSRSFVAFSVKVALSEAPSSTMYSICFPRTPPAALISSMARISASLTEVSLIAMVPLKE